MFKILGSLLDSNEREIKKLSPLVNLINEQEQKVKKISDEKLKSKTAEFKDRLEKGETLDDLLAEAFAVVREAARRTIGQRHYDVQLLGGIVLHNGKIAEMRTGEGKTLVATLPLYLNSLAGKGVHLVTVNDYLARRDAEWMGPIFHFLGLSVGVINHEQSFLYDPRGDEFQEQLIRQEADLNEPFDPNKPTATSPESEGLGTGKFLRPVSRKEAYLADITYGTNNEFGFDYLRDNMANSTSEMVQRPLHFAIVDEVDSILIDEARTPLIISAPAEESTEKYLEFAKLVDNLVPKTDYIVDEKLRTAHLTEIGIAKVERILGVKNLYETDFDSIHHIEEALKAKTLYHKDKDYVVRDNQVIIVDEFTGRLLPGRRYSEGLHQAIEAKEGVAVQRESKTLATISFQNYFRLYEKLAGMTGTAATSAEEFHKVYKLEVVVIPTHKPMIRKDFPDAIFKTEKAKWQAVVNEIEEKHKKGQPVLVGTTSIEKNELLSNLLKRKNIPHEILNAKNHEKEAQIISKGGQKGAVTIATNIAGRGVDIKLGKGVAELGGLHVIGTERHEARRIDNQLRGRSGRQGDPGSTRFYASLQDDLMRIFGGDTLAKIMDTLRLPEDMPIENNLVTKAIESAQSRVEGHNFDIRKRLVEYDDVLNKQREIIYKMRRQILELGEQATQGSKEASEKLREMVIEKIKTEVENLLLIAKSQGPDLDIDTIAKDFFSIIPFDEPSQKQITERLKDLQAEEEKTKEFLLDIADQVYLAREKQHGPTISREIEKLILLNTIDTLWINHLEDIDYLREGIGLRGYAAKDPLVEYKSEAFKLFEDLIKSIDYEFVHRIFKIQIVHPSDQKQEEKAHTEAIKKLGRNDPCPCGSGHKYKKCGLINSPTHQAQLEKAKA